MQLKQSSAAGLPGIARVDTLIHDLCAEQCDTTDPLLAALDHHLRSGGQRTRALICLECSAALGLTPSDATALACVVECLHNASLVQDDLQDSSPQRRGESAVWKAFGSNTAICLTDLLLSCAYSALGKISNVEKIPLLLSHTHNAIACTLRGQMRDTDMTYSREQRLDACIEIAQSKSGPFFALALELPLIAAGEENHLATAREATRHFGVGYQTYDDLEDLEQDEREGNAHNVVLALGQSRESITPVERAGRMAHFHLGKARSLAGLLPDNCGAVLIRQSKRLEGRLKELVS